MGRMDTKHAPESGAGGRLAVLMAHWREFWRGYWQSPHGC